MKVDIYNKKGDKLSRKADLNNAVFSVDPNDHCIYLAVKAELAAMRQGTSSSKTRSEVRGGGAKPWKQKGTGRARIGSTRNPSRVHGGSAFGPKPRDYSMKLNKKVKVLARKSALSIKISAKMFKVIDDLKMDSPKTKDFYQILQKLDMKNHKVTMFVNEANENLLLSVRNLFYVNMVSVDNFSTYDIMNSDVLLFEESCIKHLNEKLA